MKRVGFLMEKMFTEENFIRAEKLMVRIARRMRKAKESMSVHAALSCVSYFGVLKWCNSYNFRLAYVYPFASPKTCVRIISESAKRKAS